MKFLSCIIFCLLLFRPAVVVNSQTSNKEVIELLREKEIENKVLKKKVEINEKEINSLLEKLISTKTNPKKQSLYKRIFKKKAKKTEVVTYPIPVEKIEIVLPGVNKVDTIIPDVIIPPKKKKRFFKRVFQIFKTKKQ